MKKHKLLWIILAIVAVIVIAAMAGGNENAPEPTETTVSTQSTTTPLPTETEPERTEAPETVPEETEAEETEQTESEEAEPELIDGMRPDFKQAMDSYEAFMGEYCEFMERYNDDPTDLSLLADYASFLVEYEKTMSDFESWDDGSLNDAEFAYYMEVNTRVLEMLSSVQ